MKRLDPKSHNESPIVVVRFPAGLVRALDARAEVEGSTRSIVLRRALVAELGRKPKLGSRKGGTDAEA